MRGEREAERSDCGVTSTRHTRQKQHPCSAWPCRVDEPWSSILPPAPPPSRRPHHQGLTFDTSEAGTCVMTIPLCTTVYSSSCSCPSWPPAAAEMHAACCCAPAPSASRCSAGEAAPSCALQAGEPLGLPLLGLAAPVGELVTLPGVMGEPCSSTGACGDRRFLKARSLEHAASACKMHLVHPEPSRIQHAHPWRIPDGSPPGARPGCGSRR